MQFNHYFEPIVQPGNVIKVSGVTTNPLYYKVVAIEPLPYLEHDFGALNAGQIITSEVEDLYLNKNYLAQYRIRVIDTISLYIKQPASSQKFATQTGQFWITQNIAGVTTTQPDYYSNLTEFYILGDKDTATTQFVVKNPTTTALTTARVAFSGFKYKLKELKEEPKTINAEVTIGAI